MDKTERSSTVRLTGLFLWLTIVAVRFPASAFSPAYVEAILLAGPLVIIPLGFKILQIPFGWPGLGSAALFGLSFLFPPGVAAGFATLPWVVFVLVQLWHSWPGGTPKSALADPFIPLIMLAVGAAWGIACRFGWQPFGFEPIMVLLTAVHFHYAGFALTTLAQVLSGQHQPAGRLSAFLAVGVAMVALGITTTHYGGPVWVETAAVTFLVSGGFITGALLLKRISAPGEIWRKTLLGLAGCCIMSGMALAFLYGWRHFIPIPMLSIPWMYAVHGTLNSLGFSLPALAALDQKRNIFAKNNLSSFHLVDK